MPGVTLLVILVSVVIYLAPTAVAAVRDVPNFGSIAVINVLLGWTFIGWAVALAFACKDTAS